MGATNIQSNMVLSVSASEAFNRLSKSDEDYYGHQDGYSGGFNAIDSIAKCETFNNTKTDLNKIKKILKNWEDEISISKREAQYIEVKNVKTHLVEVKETKAKAQPGFVFSLYTDNAKKVASYKTIKEAKERAKEYALENSKVVTVKKELQEDVAGVYRIERKEVKRAPKKLKPNQKIEVLNGYIFFGWAAC